MKKISLAGSLVAAAALAATAAHSADVTENWTKNCASCHGKDGAGHTKAGRRLGVKDLTDAQQQKSFTDEEAFKALKDGLKDKDGGKELMKPIGDKLSDDEIKALVTYTRTLKK